MLKQLAIILFGILLVSGFIFLVVNVSEKVFDKSDIDNDINHVQIKEGTINNSSNTYDAVPWASSERGAGGGGGSGGGTSGGAIEQGYSGENYTSDINNTECGYYSSLYGVCGGYCKEGVCVSQGKSCFCSVR